MIYTIIFLVVIIVYQAIKVFGLKTTILDLEQLNDLLYVGKFNEEQKREDTK